MTIFRRIAFMIPERIRAEIIAESMECGFDITPEYLEAKVRELGCPIIARYIREEIEIMNKIGPNLK